MSQRNSLSFEDRLQVGFVCWFVIGVLLAGITHVMVLVPYVLTSAVLVFRHVLVDPAEKRHRRRRGRVHGQSEHNAVSGQTPMSEFDDLLAMIEHKVTRLNDIEQRLGVETREHVEELLQRQEFNQPKEDVL